MSKAITIIALTCFLVVGAAVTSILSRASMSASEEAVPAVVAKSPVANRESKQDRLSVISLAAAAVQPTENIRSASEILRQAYASSSTADVEAARAVFSAGGHPMNIRGGIGSLMKLDSRPSG